MARVVASFETLHKPPQPWRSIGIVKIVRQRGRSWSTRRHDVRGRHAGREESDSGRVRGRHGLPSKVRDAHPVTGTTGSGTDGRADRRICDDAVPEAQVVTDVATGWTESAPVLYREQTLLREALGEVRRLMPFDLLASTRTTTSIFINETCATTAATPGSRHAASRGARTTRRSSSRRTAPWSVGSSATTARISLLSSRAPATAAAILALWFPKATTRFSELLFGNRLLDPCSLVALWLSGNSLNAVTVAALTIASRPHGRFPDTGRRSTQSMRDQPCAI